MSDEKINSIEEMLAHQERQIHDLNDVVIAQGQSLERLEKYLRKLQNKIEVMEDSGSDEDVPLSTLEQAARDKPPHY